MGAVIGEILPFALGIAISPLPIIVVILTLLSPRARESGPGFLIGWVAGIFGVLGALTFISSFLPAPQGNHAVNPWEGVIKLVLGVLLLWLAIRQWRKRPKGDETPTLPGWMQKVDSFGFGGGLKFGLFLAAANPKNVILSLSIAVDLATADMNVETAVFVFAVFILLATSTVLIPVVAYLVASDKLHAPLEALHTWLTRENHVIMAVMLLFLGASSIGHGIGAIWP